MPNVPSCRDPLRVADAYEKLSTALKYLGISPAAVSQIIDAEADTHTVQFGGTHYPIFGPSIPTTHSWGLATFALFDIVNRQLAGHRLTLYAINGGNGQFSAPIATDPDVRAPGGMNWATSK